MNHPDDDLYGEIERRALFAMDEDDPADDAAPDLVRTLTGEEIEGAKDLTLGGYIEEHNRAPAFEGGDGQPYTVDIDAEPAPDGTGWVAFLIFIRWAETGAGIMDHVESDDVARGDTEDDARRAARDLSLYEIRAELDAAIERRRAALED